MNFVNLTPHVLNIVVTREGFHDCGCDAPMADYATCGECGFVKVFMIKDMVEIPPSEEVARVVVVNVWGGNSLHTTKGGIELRRRRLGGVVGLPPYPKCLKIAEEIGADISPETVYIVSGMVAAHPEVKGRRDVFSPGPLLRHPKGHELEGQPYGCDGLFVA